ncbi:Ppx/GppA family phosphatase [Georgenia yuyongxinii]|uniref:Ppx/GppA family phosphatase n=1 Tax=Georgenia yuyongxinii TaxID=2589797 RepID=A0A5B8C6B0_9MICO|nr:Ppx/GppA family phosphatase [Georgenia yuyongxinii]QDC26259.1 Ppx/GppA family phosphatase [Georgenia yuyongxinii]
MRLGVLDIGSNTVHLAVVDAVRDGRPDPATEARTAVRLMRYLGHDGRIVQAGVDALSRAVAAAAKAADRFGAEEMMGIATSAIREAANGPEVLAHLEEVAGVPLQVLSGREEAELTFLAARRWHGWAAGRLLVLDIGGGSLEIAMGIDEIPDFAVSVPLGAGRLTREFLPTDPPTEDELAALKAHIKTALAPVARAIAEQPRPDHVVATSKTFRSLARLAGQRVAVVGPEERRRMQLADLKDWTPRLAKLPAEQRVELPGITPERTYQIVAGGLVAQRAMKVLCVDEIETCPWALREGVLLRRLDQLN